MTIPITGYTDRLSARPGEKINFKISSQLQSPFKTELIRIVCADPNPAGPGIIEHPVPGHLEQTHPSRAQPFYPGSFATIGTHHHLNSLSSFTLSATIWPTSIEIKPQCIASLGQTSQKQSGALLIDDNGCLRAQITLNNDLSQIVNMEIALPDRLKLRHWYRVWLHLNTHNNAITLGQHEIDGGEATLTQSFASNCTLPDFDTLTLAASHHRPARDHFNGKIEAPMLSGQYTSSGESPAISSNAPSEDVDHRGSELNTNNPAQTGPAQDERLLMNWDFSDGMSTMTIRDQGPFGCHGNLINAPARAMTGSNWDGSEMCWRHAPEQYGAIHFHDDDLYDCQWETDFSFTIPPDLSSGVYAAKITCDDHIDKIPFFVCPAVGKPTAKLCVLVSTFTYTVYGNHARPDFEPNWLERNREWGAYPYNPAEYREYGLSTYNNHSDGSGICHASFKRPLMNLRPGYITFGNSQNGCSGLRHFQADSHLITWLEWNDIDYDIVTDQELHDQGVSAIQPYAAVTTGSHPEYHTTQTLDAIEQYRANGGNFMYLGGNGFYWKIATHPEQPSLLEVRRAEGGIRAWAAEPGEYYHGFDGGYGGLWRRNGRPPQRIAGVGFSGQGTFQGSYYRRNETAVSHPDTSWIFRNIDDEKLGDFGLSGGGAAGFELDRVDHRLGSNQSIRLLASSQEHDSSFVLVPEELLTHITNWPNKPVDELIRADMIYQKTASGGQLFASGSITFCGSLFHNNAENNISTLLRNVVERFTQPSDAVK